MRVIGERTLVPPLGNDEGKGKVVIVGVKLDSKSIELLTWALMTVASPGDLVIALHVLDSLHGFADGPGAFLSLLQTFDSLLSAYDGFCNLKQVSLKLKLCRGPSARKMLVKEARESNAAKVVVGACSGNHISWPWKSFANYCMKKLPKTVSVFAVRNGKPCLRRDVSSDGNKPEDTKKRNGECHYCKLFKDTRAIVPHHKYGSASSSNNCLVQSPLRLSRLRQFLQQKSVQCEKKTLKRPNTFPSSLVHPDKNHSLLSKDKHAELVHCSSLICVTSDLREELEALRQQCGTCRQFTYLELLKATCNFGSENLVGQGGSSYVYKGCLPNGEQLAVKILKPFKDVMKEFLIEANVITSLKHINIISLMGFCFEHEKLFLVYDFLPRGSLEENLNGCDIFDWDKRLNVALGVAEALNYLHNDLDQPVIHRDVKSSNILLSDDFEPRLSDFGFSCHVSEPSSSLSCSDVPGTFGYMAPEYFMHGKVSDKADVYAFGVVLLEILSGKKAISSKAVNSQESLVMWAKPILEGGKVSQLIDSRVRGYYDEAKIEKMFLAAKLCLNHSAKQRPPISTILKVLRGEEETIESAKLQVVAFDGDALAADLQSHLSLAFLDVDDDSFSVISNEMGLPCEDYLRTRWPSLG